MKEELPIFREMFSEYYMVDSEGLIIGICSCFVCGASIIVSEYDPWIKQRHYDWHKKINKKEA